MASYRTYSALYITSEPHKNALRRAPMQGEGSDLGFRELLGVSERQKPRNLNVMAKVGAENILKGHK